MKDRILFFIKAYLLITSVFVLQKPLFMVGYCSLFADATWTEWLQVMWHGLAHDLSVAGYLTVIPGLLLMVSAWTTSEHLRRTLMVYFGLIATILSVIFVVDMGLYGFWDFRLDATPLFYFFSSPADSLASVSVGFIIGGIAAMIACTAVLYGLLHWFLLRKDLWKAWSIPQHRIGVSLGILLLTALLFIPIRGGLSVSTMNTGKVYFSTNIRLNQAAINPAFSLMESLSTQTDFAEQYPFMDAAEADALFAGLVDPTVLGSDATCDSSMIQLVKEPRPNIIFVIAEGFSSHLMATLGGDTVATNLDRLGQEGVLFSNFYATSYRTDRGLVSILGGYPAPPTISVMQYPNKTALMPSIAHSLGKVGYSTTYYYGGDADYTNMRSYIHASGFETLITERDFPVSERLSKWGVHDHLLLQRVLSDLQAEGTETTCAPYFRVVQTSSSHEPFEVPYHRLEDIRLNAFAYTDSCIGAFVDSVRTLPQWEHTLILIVADHLGSIYRPGHTPERYQIPMIMVGGAVNGTQTIDTFGSQNDIAATLLAQLGLPHSEFTFSKNMLNPCAPHFASFAIPHVCGMVTADNRMVFDCESATITIDDGEAVGKNFRTGQAYLQKLYDDLARY